MKQNYVRRLNVRDVVQKINQYARSRFGKIGEWKFGGNHWRSRQSAKKKENGPGTKENDDPPDKPQQDELSSLYNNCKMLVPEGSWIVIKNFQGVKLCPLQVTAQIKIESRAMYRDIFAV